MKNLSTRGWKPKLKYQKKSKRRGSVTVLAVCVLVMLFGMLAFTADIGFITATRSQMRNAADAAALAACQELPAGMGKGATSSISTVKADAENAAMTLAGHHRAGDVASASVKPGKDFRFGRRDWDPQQLKWIETWNSTPYNMVEVRVRRDQPFSGAVTASSPADRQLKLFFAPVLNQKNASVTVSATAAVLPVVGFSLPAGSTKTVGILPIALDLPTWEALIQNDIGPDSFAYNPNTGSVYRGQDGIREVNLYPSGSSSMPPGNRGTVDLGNPNNSTMDLKRQILYGLNAEDLSYFPNGQIRTDNGLLYLNGDTGISAGIKAELSQIIGQTRAIPIFTDVSGPGNNAMYTVVKFVGIRVLEVVLTGSLSSKHLTVQPAVFEDSNAIGGKAATAPDTISSPIKLIH